MITEGTYPYAVGGVSSWCSAVIGQLTSIDWDILPIVAGGKRLHQTFTLPPHARLLRPIELWTDVPLRPTLPNHAAPASSSLPSQLLRGLLPWQPDVGELTKALVRCRMHPQVIRREFRSKRAWEDYLSTLAVVLGEHDEDTAPAPIYDAIEAARLYQALYWVARPAAVRTPRCDLLHITAAGWSVIPALVDKALYGTPLLVTEHGVYVREAYLAALRDRSASLAQQHTSTRLALGLTHAAYAAADMIAPVTEANAAWERGLGVERNRIRVIPNGLPPTGEPTPPPNAGRVVALGRIDPLKDVQTMLLVADEVIRRGCDATFEYWGPVTAGEERYGQACERMLAALGLGPRFRFMGRTTNPQEVIRSCDLVLMTSISEGMPMSLLEAMAQSRPVVATTVGGVPGVLQGCGILAPPGDVHQLASGVVALLRNPRLAAALGRRGNERLKRHYTLDRCVTAYDELIKELIGWTPS